MKLRFTMLAAVAAVLTLSGCATMQPNSIREVSEQQVKGCRALGNVSGSDAVFVGLSAAVGSKNAKARAINQAVGMKASDVVWSQSGTSMTSEWLGKAYACN